ncbi:MAG: NAD-dependent epimerase/dehydratase family protein [Vicinamibacterales bacterium]
MRYFITGATGFIGGAVTRQLIGAGHEVSALVRSRQRAGDLTRLGVELHEGDLLEPSSLRRPMEGADGVFHLAAWYKIGVREPAAARINVDGTRAVLETMREQGIAKGVYTSTVGVFGDTRGRLVDETYRSDGPFLTEYDRTKWQAHYEVALPMAEAGLPLVIVMPGAVYGPGDTSQVGASLAALLRGRFPMAPAQTTFSWGYIDDVAHGIVRAMERGRIAQSYLLTGPCHTFEAFMDEAASLAGVPAPRLHPGPRVMRVLAAGCAALERVGVRPPYSPESLRLMAGTTWIGSHEKASRELGFEPRPIAAGLALTLASLAARAPRAESRNQNQ